MTIKELHAIASVLLCGAARDYIEANGTPDEEGARTLLEQAAIDYAHILTLDEVPPDLEKLLQS